MRSAEIRAWFPPGFPEDEARSIMAFRVDVIDPNYIKLTKGDRSGFMQAAQVDPEGAQQQHPFLIFQEAKMNASNPTVMFTPFQGATQIEFRLSTQDVPSRPPYKAEFEQAFSINGIPPIQAHEGHTKGLDVVVDADGNTREVPVVALKSEPITQPGTPVAAMNIEVPQQGFEYHVEWFLRSRANDTNDERE